MRVIVLSHEDVVQSLPPAECAEAMADVLAEHARGEAFMPLRHVMMPPGAAGFMGLMPAWRGGDNPVFSLKTVCIIRENPSRGLDAHQGTVTLYDGVTGMPTAVLDASAITEIRTAAVTAVATRLLAREDSRVLGILGAGVQGRAHIESLVPVRQFEQIKIYSPTTAHAEAVADSAPDGAPAVEVTATAEEAVRGSDVVVVATSASRPVLEHAWLDVGAHVNAVGASSPTSWEINVETVVASALYADSRESVQNEAGEFRLAVEEGRIAGVSHIRGEIGELLIGKAQGRQRHDELTLFRSLGIGVEDLAAAERAVANARRLGLGTEVEM